MIQEILANFASVQVWLGLAVGVIGGMVIGAMPGLSGGMAIALLLPVTYSMEPVAALVMLMAIYTAAMTGGSDYASRVAGDVYAHFEKIEKR